MGKYDTTNRDKKREETEKRILEASIIHFGKLGYTHTILRDIANDSGVAYGLINRYFSTKENLLTEAYQYALKKIYMKNQEIYSVYDILIDLIDCSKVMQKEYPDFFLFFKTVMNSSDLPDAFWEDRKKHFLESDRLLLYSIAQERGELPKGNLFGLFQMFLVSLYNLLDMNARYGLPEPDYKVFLDVIHYIRPEERQIRELQNKLARAMGDTYAVLSLINIQENTGSQIYTKGAVVDLTDSSDIRASLLHSIDVYVCEGDRQRMQDFLDLETIPERLKNKKILVEQCKGTLGKMLQTIIPFEWDDNGRIIKILAGIQVIESNDA